MKKTHDEDDDWEQEHWDSFIRGFIADEEREQFEKDGYVDEEDDEARAFNAGWYYEPPDDDDEDCDDE